MKTRTYKVYQYDELTPEQQQKAIEIWRNGNEMECMLDAMEEHLRGLLATNKIEGEAKINYSLSCSQGDGAMFEGDFKWKGYNINIKHNGHYYHYGCKTMDFNDDSWGDTDKGVNEIVRKDREKFEELYKVICKKLESYGYDYINEENDEVHIAETMRINRYYFTEAGTIDS